MRTIDYRVLKIKCSRITKKSSIAGCHVDHYTFRLFDKVWRCKVIRKDSCIILSASESLELAVNSLETLHEVKIKNKPRRVNESKTEWVKESELFKGDYPIVN